MSIYLIPITKEVRTLISEEVDKICKINKINKEKQNYRIFFKNSKISCLDNDRFWISGSKKYLSFSGRVYSNILSPIKETSVLDEQEKIIIIDNPSIVIVDGGARFRIEVQEDIFVEEFYIAPLHLLKGSDLSLWHQI